LKSMVSGSEASSSSRWVDPARAMVSDPTHRNVFGSEPCLSLFASDAIELDPARNVYQRQVCARFATLLPELMAYSAAYDE
ncbi:MAG: hypothetical protein ACR2FK_06890, partial [Sphingomicrobium sp.]